MKRDPQFLGLLTLVVLALVGTVVLTLAGQVVPDVLDLVVASGAGALFGVTVPRRAGGAVDTP
ncbi:hypothetical protein [Streptomyces sp. NPDC056144]|uniref:hypothetical protein n=1 Tax=unclassified Streptomyces TaxID=2593676 RepID=UPI0035DAF0AE